jgi:hypothetical protein
MAIRLITPCVGRKACSFFRSPEDLLCALEVPPDFKNLMMAMEIAKKWKRFGACPFKIKDSGQDDGEFFHVSICKLASRPPFSMDAVSRGTGYSKTRVAQIEYTACRKMKRKLGRSTFEAEIQTQV